MANAITGTPNLSGSPTNYSGSNNQLSQAIQTIWSKEILDTRGPRRVTGE